MTSAGLTARVECDQRRRRRPWRADVAAVPGRLDLVDG